MAFHLFDENKEIDDALSNKHDDLQIGQYNNNFAVNDLYSKTLEEITEKFQLPASIAVPFVLAGGTAEHESAKQIAEEVVYNRAKKEGEIWQELQEKYQYENLEDNMKMSFGDLLTFGIAPGGAKPGDVQYGVWAFAGLDALFQTFGPSGKWSVIASAANALVPGQPMVVGRSQAYLRDLRAYDKLLQDGYSPAEAQSKLQIDVSMTEVEDIGKDTNLRGDMRKHIAMMREANDMGGEAVLWNMFRQVANGKPVNFDRGTKITLESVKAEDTPYYNDLITNYNMTPEEARKFIYNKIGSPIKNFDENGQLNYTSSFKPNQINFYAGRHKQRFMFSSDYTQQELYRPEFADKNILLEYSPGKVYTGEIFEPGSVQFDMMSGTIDAAYQIVPELLAGKGVKGVSNLRKGFRRINDAVELTHDVGTFKKGGFIRQAIPDIKKNWQYTKEGKVNLSPRGIANKIADTVADEADPFTGTGNFSKHLNPKTGKLKDLDEVVYSKKTTRKAVKETKKDHTFFGRVPRFFQLTKDDILSQPIMEDFFKTLAATTTDDIFALSTNPYIGKLHPKAIQAIAEEADWQKQRKIWGDMLDTGFQIVEDTGMTTNVKLATYFKDGALPVKGSFVLNKLLQQAATKGTELQKSKGVFGKAMGTALSAVGDERAAYRSAGSFLGEKARVGRTMLEQVIPGSPTRRFKKLLDRDSAVAGVLDDLDSAGELIQAQKVVDKYGLGDKLEFEKYLGFSSNFNSTYNPYYRKLLGLIPGQGIPLNSFSNGYKQLISHLQINAYGDKTANKIINQFLNIDFADKSAVRNFGKELMQYDLELVKSRAKYEGDESWKYVLAAQARLNEGLDKSKLYALMRDKKILPNTGSGYEMYRIKTPDGKYVDMPMMTGSMLTEMSDNVVPLMNHKIIQRAMGRMWQPYSKDLQKDIAAMDIFKKNVQDVVDYGKYKLRKSADGTDLKNPYEEGVITVKRLEEDFVGNILSFYTRNVFKPFVLLRAAFFTRVFLEEQARIAVSGLSGIYNHPFKYIQWLAAHDPNSKVGKVISKIPLDRIRKAEYSDDGVELLASIEAIEASKNSFKATELFGPSRNKKNTEYLAKLPDELNRDEYSQQWFTELLFLRTEGLAQKVAEFGYGSKALNEWLSSPAGRDVRMQYVKDGGSKWQEILKDGDFLDQHLQYLESRIRIKSGGDVVEGKDLFKQKDGTYRYNLTSKNLGEPAIREAIAKGQLKTKDGKVLDFFENPEKSLKMFKKKAVLDELGRFYDEGVNGGAVKITRKLIDENSSLLQGGWDEMLNVAFDNLITKPIGYLNRSPVFKQYRWEYITSQFKNYSPALQKQFIKEAQDAAVPQSVIDELKGLSNLWKKGTITDYDAMNVESKAFGLAMVKNLLYDTSQKHALSDKLLNIFPFVEVWFEVFQTWGQLLAANPTVLRKGYVGLRGGTAADDFGSSSEDGFFTQNPNEPDKDMFVLPFGGWMSNIIFGDDSNTRISPKGYVQGVNLLGQGFVPGPNPLVGFAANKVLSQFNAPDMVIEGIFGDFPPPEKITDAFAVSPVYKKFAAALVSPEDFENITEDSREIHKLRANATADIFRFGMASGENMKLYNEGKLNSYLNTLFPNQWDAESITQKQIDEAFLEYAKIKSGKLFFMQFAYQFFGPTGFKPEYFIKDNDGALWGTAVLYDEYVRIVEKNEGNNLAAYTEFLTLYGIEHPYITSPKSQSETGRKPSSKRVQEFQEENKEIFDQLKLSGYYLNIDNPNEEKNYRDIVAEKSLMSPDQYRRAVNDTIGFFRYKTFTSNLEKLDIPYAQKNLIKTTYREELKQALPGFQADEYGLLTPPAVTDIFNEMRNKWTTIDFVADQEAGKGFLEILPYWEEMEQISREESAKGKVLGTTTWWLTSNDPTALSMRIWMYNKAQQIIAEYPDFWGVWNGVMLKLYRDDYEVLDYIK